MKAFAFLLALLVSAGASAQSDPSRAIKMVVPAPSGGELDAIAQPFAEKLSSVLGRPVVLEHRPGRAGDTGAAYAARQPADGYTMLFASDFLATNPPRLKSPPYDPLKDFAAVSKIGTIATALAISPGVNAKDWRELATLSKEKGLTFATPGLGSLPHLAGELLSLQGAIRLEPVPYKNVDGAIAAAVGGKVDIVIAALPSLAPQITAGKLRGIALLGPKPSRIVRGLPTIAEAGGPNIDADAWYGLFVPARTSPEIVMKLNSATVQAIESQDLVAQLRKAGVDAEWTRPDVLANLLKNDLAKWQRVVADAGHLRHSRHPLTSGK